VGTSIRNSNLFIKRKESKMKKQLSIGTVVAFVTLFVFSLIGEAVIFRMVEVPPSPPPHGEGETFRVDFMIDAADLGTDKLSGVTIVATVTPVNGKAIPQYPSFCIG
jgi:hypothetical protein